MSSSVVFKRDCHSEVVPSGIEKNTTKSFAAMARRVELSVGNTTGVPSLADQIKRFQPKVFANADDIGDRVFDRTAKASKHVQIFTKSLHRKT